MNGCDPDRRSAASAPFDYERSVARLGGDPGLFEEITLLFLEDSPRLLEQARAGLNERDPESLARAAHNLKNLSANFDAQALTIAAGNLEQHVYQDGLQGADSCLADMECELERLQAALAAFGRSDKR
jgi:HPt (histidine-containing phosphotransfer) domain-containing protein